LLGLLSAAKADVRARASELGPGPASALSAMPKRWGCSCAAGGAAETRGVPMPRCPSESGRKTFAPQTSASALLAERGRKTFETFALSGLSPFARHPERGGCGRSRSRREQPCPEGTAVVQPQTPTIASWEDVVMIGRGLGVCSGWVGGGQRESTVALAMASRRSCSPASPVRTPFDAPVQPL
jgi:hypothetical protein